MEIEGWLLSKTRFIAFFQVSYLLSLPTGTDMTTDGVDVYRRLSLTNHGDTFYLQNTDEITEVLLNIVGSYFFPENVAVGYGKTGDQMVPTTIDQQNDVLFVLITIDPSTSEWFSLYLQLSIFRGTIANYQWRDHFRNRNRFHCTSQLFFLIF